MRALTDTKGNAITQVGLAGPIETTKFGNPSYFVKTGTYLNSANQSDMDLGYGDYTIELWTNLLYQNQTNPTVFTSNIGSWTTGAFELDIYRGGATTVSLWIYDVNTGAAIITSSNVAFNIGKWYHLALTRQNGTTRLFVNGVLEGSISNSYKMNASNIGFSGMLGLQSSIKIYKGFSKYNSAFSPDFIQDFAPPTTDVVTQLSSSNINKDTSLTLPLNKTYLAQNFDQRATNVGSELVATGLTNSYGVNGYGSYRSNTATSPNSSLQVPSTNGEFDFGSGDWTMECWMYPTSTNLTIDSGLFSKRLTNASYGAFLLIADTSNLRFRYFFGSTGTSWDLVNNVTSPSNVFALNTWSHVVFMRSGNNVYTYVNGVLIYVLALTGTLVVNNSVAINIAALTSDGVGNFIGNLADVRITKGIARYATTNLTQAVDTRSGASDPYDSNVVLDISGKNGYVTDAKGHAVTKNGVAELMAGPVFGTKVLYLPWTGDYLNVTHASDLNLNNSDWTIECWFYMTQPTTYTMLFNKAVSSSGNFDFFYNNTNKYLRLDVYTTGTASTSYASGTLNLNTRTWYHIAAQLKDGWLSFWVDGKMLGNPQAMNSTFFAGTDNLGIGASISGSGSQYAMGLFNGIRITKAARYRASILSDNLHSTNDPYTSYSVLDMDMETLTDAKGKTVTPISSAALSTVQKKFDTKSLLLNGTSQYLQIPASSDFDFGLDTDFTMECWLYLTGDAAPNLDNLRHAGFLTQGTSSNLNGFELTVLGTSSTTGTGIGVLCTINSATSFTMSTAITVTKNVWHNVIVQRKENIFYLIYDGAVVNRKAGVAQFGLSTNPVNIGAKAYTTTNYPHYFPGYIDNVRISKGLARYDDTGFTPTAFNQGVSDPFNAQTVLDLDCQTMTDAKGHTVTAVGAAHIYTPPDLNNKPILMSDNGSCYLTVKNNSDFWLGLGDFTLECDVYMAKDSSNNWMFSISTGTNCQFQLYYNTAGHYIGIDYSTSGTNTGLYINNVTLSFQTWYHVAVVRNNGWMYLFLNGQQVGDVRYQNNAYFNSTADLWIGRSQDSTSYYLIGMINNIKITKGVARYTPNFIPPNDYYSLASDPYRSNVSLHAPFNNLKGLTYDETGKQISSPNSTSVSVFDTTLSPFNKVKAFSFPGNINGYDLVQPSPDLNLSTLDFTIEFWFRPKTASATIPTVFSNNQTWGAGAVYLEFNRTVAPTAAQRFALWINSYGTSAPLVGNTITLNFNQWYHVALTRSGNNFRLFVNGSLDSSSSAYTGSIDLSSGIILGKNLSDGASGYSPGYIDGFKVTKGIAKYISAFTPINRLPTEITLPLTKRYLTIPDSASGAFAGGIVPPLLNTASPGAGVRGTLEGWIYLTAYPSQNNVFYQENDGTHAQIGLSISTTGQFGGGSNLSSNVIPLKRWTHIVISWSGTNCKFYVNGTLDSSQTMTGTWITSAGCSLAGFGRLPGDTWTTYAVPHMLDCVRMYSYQIPQSLVTAHYNNGTPLAITGPEPGLVAGYNFDGATTYVVDKSGTGRHINSFQGSAALITNSDSF